MALKLFLSTCGESHGVVHSQTMREKEAEMIYWCNRHPSPACSFRHDLKNLITSVNIFIQMLWESKKEFLKVQRYKGHISCSKAVESRICDLLSPAQVGYLESQLTPSCPSQKAA